jgi:enoyl-CoA hydratase/carnithine racemase
MSTGKAALAIVTLRRPPANAMDIALTEEIASVFQNLGKDRSINSFVLTGQGKSFCAGVDLKTVPSFDAANQRRMVDALNRAFYAVYACPVPVVGAINGHAIAGGLVLALCCDFRIATNTGFLTGLTEVRVGVPYPVAAMEVVRQELRPDVARRMILFGQNVTASVGLEADLFDEMVEAKALPVRAMAAAHEFAALPRNAFVNSKRELRRGAYQAIEAAIAGGEPLLSGWLSRETVEAAAAVLGRSA